MKQFLAKHSTIFISLLGYFVLVELIVVLFKPNLFFNSEILLNRLIYLFLFILSYFTKSKLNFKIWNLLTILLVYAALSFLYKETAILNQIFQSEIDSNLIALDHYIWGFQPALRFSEILNMSWISELMFFGYFSYYLMPLVVFAVIYNKIPLKLEEFGFVLITSFLIYYIIFIILPAFGPQFFFSLPDNYIEAQGIFGQIIKIIQENGEAKTAAFPSSHVGISIIVLLWLWNNLRTKVIYFIPTTIILILATVYIKAHYSIDVVAGLFSAPFIYYLSITTYKKLKVFKSNEYQY